MATQLIVDLNDPDMAAMLSDCQPGEEKTFTTASGTLKSKDDKKAVFDITDLEYSDESVDNVSAPDDAAEEPPVKKAPKGNPAVAAAKETY